MTPPPEPQARKPRTPNQSQADRAAGFAETQRRLKAEAAERRSKGSTVTPRPTGSRAGRG